MDGEIRDILLGVQQGTVSVDQALLHLKQKPFEDLGYAKVDLHRKLRQGAGEVIYGAGKTAQQIAGILAGFRGNGQENMLITRMDAEKAAFVKEKLPITYYEDCGIGILGENARPWGMGKIVIATGGTSDQRVAEEAARTAEFLGNEVVRLYDVGVSGIHRLLSNRAPHWQSPAPPRSYRPGCSSVQKSRPSLALLHMVHHGGQISGSKAVIDVHNGHAAGTGIEHG